jgi:hypothetical protein
MDEARPKPETLIVLSALLIAAALISAQAPDPTPQDRPPTPEEVDALQQLYDSSCGSRGYAQYDDVCILITKQIEDAKKAAAQSERLRHRAGAGGKSLSPPKPPQTSGPEQTPQTVKPATQTTPPSNPPSADLHP